MVSDILGSIHHVSHTSRINTQIIQIIQNVMTKVPNKISPMISIS